MTNLRTFCDSLEQMIRWLMDRKTTKEKVRDLIEGHIKYVMKASGNIAAVAKEREDYVYYLSQLRGPLNKPESGTALTNARDINKRYRPAFENKLRQVDPKNILLK